MVTVLDHYTTSFNWPVFNFAAIWLRPQWYLVTNSAITDVQQAGLTMVTGGGYTASDVITGHWALLHKSALIGNTQEDNSLASNGGPFNPQSRDLYKIFCAQDVKGSRPGNYCLAADEGVSWQINSFGMYQRLFSVYDGPAYQDSNAYLNIKSRKMDDCVPLSSKVIQPPPLQSGICDTDDAHKRDKGISSDWVAGIVLGLPKATPDPKDNKKDFCYMPNAAIGWKQPNGFYYPPAFHSTKLYFKDVETRHFVVTPLFQGDTFDTDTAQVNAEYCAWNKFIFNGFTSIDRQTVLNDDDGSLTGYSKTIAVNLVDFYSAPNEALQCASDNTSKTSPYAYVTTVVYPGCAVDKTCAIPATDADGNRVPNPHTGNWDRACSNENCYGIPLYRLDLTKSDNGAPKSIRMTGQSTGQRSILTVNQGTYYVDTKVPKADQMIYVNKTVDPPVKETCAETTPTNQECNITVFQENKTYYLFLIYANKDTAQTYRFYVGPGLTENPATELNLKLVQANLAKDPVTFPTEFTIPSTRVSWVGDKKNGIVEVTLMAADFPGIADKISAAKQNACQPATFCALDGTTCKQCTAFDTDPQSPTFGKCKTFGSDEICKWAGADPHCPEGGCIGIKFTLLTGFNAGARPDPKPLATDLKCSGTAFQTPLTPVSAGTCPAVGTGTPPVDDRMEPNFADVVATNGKSGNCQDPARQYTAADPFPHCKCP